MQSERTEAPYAGLRVLELARVLAGPWIGQALADLGAQVIKVESPDGDETRRWGPPFLENADGSAADAAYFHSCNRGKESLVLDFRKAADRERVVRLARGADVLIENFKVGGLGKYGLDYASLAPLNPALVYCSISGFGQDGRYADRPGYDFVAQAMSGLMDITGDPGHAPQKVGVAVADIVTGLYGLVGIQAALAERARSGRGQRIDVALLDSTIGILANQVLNRLIGNLTPTRMGNAHPNIAPYQEFRTADGFIVVAVGNDAQFRCLCAALGCAQLADDPRFAGNAARVRNRATLEQTLAPLLAALRREDALARLEAAGVPSGPINTVAEALADPNTRERAMVVACPAEGYSSASIPGLAIPIRFSRSQTSPPRPAPRLGSAPDDGGWR
ncbi:MAG TPA: CoA transferase [Steroidobacteraceae bacterium]|jgi:crotonobetainyl-CoA:carnitine CoA-transferase CaiB-like acyl-CoA transferase|nr:CoA transferase [Steroidobacteraceae bacterium]